MKDRVDEDKNRLGTRGGLRRMLRPSGADRGGQPGASGPLERQCGRDDDRRRLARCYGDHLLAPAPTGRILRCRRLVRLQARRSEVMTLAMEAPAPPGNSETAVGVTATATSTASVLSCAACCVLPLALPASALAGAGATLSWFESASPWP